MPANIDRFAIAWDNSDGRRQQAMFIKAERTGRDKDAVIKGGQ